MDEPTEETPSARERRLAPEQDAAVLAACEGWLCVARGSAVHLISTANLGMPSYRQLPAEAGIVNCASFDPQGLTLVTGGEDKRVRLWALPTGAGPVGTPTISWLHHKKIGCVAFSPDGAIVMWADRFGELFSAPRGESRDAPLGAPNHASTLVLGHLSPVSHMAFSPCGTALLTADREGHVRNSCWPDAFIIQHYCLAHTAPLRVMLPLTHAPLLLTAASEGRDVCLWRMHSDALVARMPAAALLASHAPGATPAAGGASGGAPEAAGLIAACEIAPQRLVALCFRGVALVAFSSASSPWDATAAELRPRPQLNLTTEGPPLAVAHSAMGVLCALTASAVLLFPAKAGGDGFDAVRLASLPLLPAAAPAEGDAAKRRRDEEEDDDE